MRPEREPYLYRKLSPRERKELVEWRKSQGMPWHAPPHYSVGEAWYLLSVSNYEHKRIMNSEDRRMYLQHRLLEGMAEIDAQVTAWVVLPNHYHVLARLPDIKVFGGMTRTLHRGTAYEWNPGAGKCGIVTQIVRFVGKVTTTPASTTCTETQRNMAG